MLGFSTAEVVFSAFSFQVSSVSPVEIFESNQEITVKLNITDLPNPSYFRVALQKSPGEPYFGQIKNNLGDWIDIKSLSSDCKDYYFHDATGSSELNLVFKSGDLSAKTPGIYQLVGHRFTATSCSNTKSVNTKEITLAFPANTPTSLPSTPIPNPAPTSKPVQVSLPSSILKPSSTSKPVSAPKIYPSIVPPSPPKPTSKPEVLAFSAVLKPTANLTPTPIPALSVSLPPNQVVDYPKTQKIFSPIIILTGLSLLGLAIYRLS